MAINSFNVSYPDFELGEIINPDEFDVNFADIMIRMNQLIDIVNQITDGTGGNGADIVHIGDIVPFTEERLQPLLEALVTKLQNAGIGSGAEFIGSLPINGLVGDNVHEQLLSLSTSLIDLQNELVNEVSRIDSSLLSNSTAIGALEIRATANETAITSKADTTEVYTKSQADINIANLEATIHDEFYDKLEANALLDGKVSDGANHTGQWQGIDVDDLFNVFGVSGAIVDTVEPTSPYENLLWYDPTYGQYRIYLNGQWRENGAPTRIVEMHNRVTLGVDSTTVDIGIPTLDPSRDAFMVYQNSTYIAKTYEYSTNGTQITNLNGTWTAGTVFDFVAFISTPVA